MYPDSSLYPIDSVPLVVRKINNTLTRCVQIRWMEGRNPNDPGCTYQSMNDETLALLNLLYPHLRRFAGMLIDVQQRWPAIASAQHLFTGLRAAVFGLSKTASGSIKNRPPTH